MAVGRGFQLEADVASPCRTRPVVAAAQRDEGLDGGPGQERRLEAAALEAEDRYWHLPSAFVVVFVMPARAHKAMAPTAPGSEAAEKPRQVCLVFLAYLLKTRLTDAKAFGELAVKVADFTELASGRRLLHPNGSEPGSFLPAFPIPSFLFRMVGFSPCAENRNSRLADIVAEYPTHERVTLTTSLCRELSCPRSRVASFMSARLGGSNSIMLLQLATIALSSSPFDCKPQRRFALPDTPEFETVAERVENLFQHLSEYLSRPNSHMTFALKGNALLPREAQAADTILKDLQSYDDSKARVMIHPVEAPTQVLQTKGTWVPAGQLICEAVRGVGGDIKTNARGAPASGGPRAMERAAALGAASGRAAAAAGRASAAQVLGKAGGPSDASEPERLNALRRTWALCAGPSDASEPEDLDVRSYPNSTCKHPPTVNITKFIETFPGHLMGQVRDTKWTNALIKEQLGQRSGHGDFTVELDGVLTKSFGLVFGETLAVWLVGCWPPERYAVLHVQAALPAGRVRLWVAGLRAQGPPQPGAGAAHGRSPTSLSAACSCPERPRYRTFVLSVYGLSIHLRTPFALSSSFASSCAQD
ncbi:unnamed protein product [Prorocentrum cordatum]|uniref:Uncharacterized protein n=1 Tax=Prorocentrum cordatum TaxID=2364126 RepID=A0ABN9VFT5_9DINO|nr:unnamed protein product [Polarella glacialis]